MNDDILKKLIKNTIDNLPIPWESAVDGLSADYTVYAPECTGSPGGKSGEN